MKPLLLGGFVVTTLPDVIGNKWVGGFMVTTIYCQ